ncbi:MAG: arylsulfatase [Lentisphaeraceae bacterium]|nr:arylsulfatase [Lentisphaeraceae bacterium]
MKKCIVFSLLFLSFLTVFADNKPNVVVILVDDMGYSDIGCYGGEIETPNLNALAAKGLRYSSMYNTSKCTTTRSSLLMGRYVIGPSYAANYSHGLTIGEVAKRAGYRTLWSGKNHSSIRPPERGFDRFYGFQGGACNFWNPGPSLKGGGKFPHIKAYEWMVDDKWLKTYIPEDPNYFMTDAITDNALAWLNEYEKEEKPFFLYLAYNAPHWPLHAPDKDIEKYKGKYDAGYQEIRKTRYKRMIDLGIIDPKVAPLFPEEIDPWDSLSDSEKKLEAERMEVHAAMVDNLDQNIGRVIKKLKEQGEFENTLILFLADNGASHERDKRAFKNYTPTGKEKMGGVMSYECIGKNWARVSNTPFAKHKVSSHEGGVCTPMIAHWPKGIEGQNKWFHEPAHLVDILPTVGDLLGVEYPQEAKAIEGVSLKPSFSGKSLSLRNVPIGFNFAKGKGVRVGSWKLVNFGKKDNWELYNLAKDRTETKNLAKLMPEKLEDMKKAYAFWLAKTTEGLNLPIRKKK